MISKDQIQSLIAEIDGVLQQKATPRFPFMSGEATQQRRVLERVRNYLVALQKQQTRAPAPTGNRSDLLAYDIQSQPPQPSVSETPQEMLQAVAQEVGYLRSSLVQPLRTEIESLQQQRDRLRQEIQQLDQRRGGLPGGNQQQINEFLQVLMGRLQESLSQQITQVVQSQTPYGRPALPSAVPSPSYQSLEQLRAVQAQSDQLLINLDTTLRVVMEGLQRDVKSYQESLAQGVDRMHSLGQQGELMFNALINHLAQQLGREASVYLQPVAPSSGETTPEPPAPIAATNPPVTNLPATNLPATNPPATSPAIGLPNAGATTPPPAIAFPYPGVEIASAPPTSSTVDGAIEDWLRSVSTSDSPSKESADFDRTALGLGLDPTQLDPQEIDLLLDLPLNPAPPGPSTSPSARQQSSNREPMTRPVDRRPPDRREPSPPIVAAPTVPTASTQSAAISPDAQAELDEFYQSLFGAPTESSPPIDPLSIKPAPVVPAPVVPPTAPASSASTTASTPASQPAARTAPSSDPTLGWDLTPPTAPAVAETLAIPIAPSTPAPSTPAPSPVEAPVEEPASAPAHAADTIQALTDLIDTSLPGLPEPVVSSPPPPSVTPGDRYAQAAPEESLLPTREPAAQNALWLDELTLSHLHAELSSLESGSTTLFPEQDLPEQDLPELNLTVTGLAAPPAPDAPALLEEDWDDPSLDDAATPIAEDRSEPGAVTLEEFGALFEDRAADDIPPSTKAIPPPEAAVRRTSSARDDRAAFTLEGMNDLFAEFPSVSSTPVPPPMSSPPAPDSDQPLAFTLEGMDDLFADLPATAPPAATSAEKKTQPS